MTHNTSHLQEWQQNIVYGKYSIQSCKDLFTKRRSLWGKNQKPIQNNHIWLVVVLWRCFLRQLPVQNNHFRVVSRVVVLYRFDCIKSFFLWKCPIKNKRSSMDKKNDRPKKYLLQMDYKYCFRKWLDIGEMHL